MMAQRSAFESGRFRLGVNYWPARSAMGFWKNWDRGELSRDFLAIQEAGLDSVRLFLTWEDFQPSPDVVDTKVLDLLKKTLDLAFDLDLAIMPTLYTGHMSGANWFPGWAVERETERQRFRTVCGGQVVRAQPLNWFTDMSVRTAQVKLAAECSSALAGHPALFAWDLGNENSNCVGAPDEASGREWLHAICAALRSRDSKTPITIGLHMEDLEEYRGITPKNAAEACDFLTMHGYPGYAPFTDGATDERLLPFLTQLTRFLGEGMEVLFSEFGVPTHPNQSAWARSMTNDSEGGPQLVSEDEAASYVRRGLRALQQGGATGAMLWCHADYFEDLLQSPPFDAAPHEGTFGLFRSNGTPKPVVDAVRSFSEQGLRVESRPRVASESFIDLTHDDYYDDPKRHLRRLFVRYCASLGETRPFSE